MSERRVIRAAQLAALALCVGMGLAIAYANVSSWELEDAQAYWNAALRLRNGVDLYIPVPVTADETIAYRYAPWLAWVWVPLTYLPKGFVEVMWSIVLLAAAAVTLLPLARVRTVAAICLLFLLGGLVVRTASTGNVQTLLVAALVWGVVHRSGPIWIGVAASLKIAPILYAAVYLGRGELRNAILAVAVAAILWLPALLYDLSGYPAEAGQSLSLLSWAGPAPWVLLTVTLAAGAIVLARSRYRWLAASSAVITAIPRLDLYALTYLLVGQPDPAGDAATAERRSPDDRAIQPVRTRT